MQTERDGQFEIESYRRLPLPGDASTRRYFRLVPRSGGGLSLVLMEFEESRGAADAASFMSAARLFRDSGCPVPRIIRANPRKGWIILEDLGDLTLERSAARAPDPSPWYEKAVQVLIRLHSRSGAFRNRFPEIFTRRMDEARIRMELDFLRHHGLESSRPLAAGEEEAFQRAVQFLVENIAPRPVALNHRDYHSRNIMVRGKEIVLVDFQDALLATPFYDLASLLRDSYRAVPRAESEALTALYLREARAAGIPVPESDAEAGRLFDLVALQRNLKALGTFSFQGFVLGRKKYLSSIPLTLEHIRANGEAASPDAAPLVEIVERELGEVS